MDYRAFAYFIVAVLTSCPAYGFDQEVKEDITGRVTVTGTQPRWALPPRISTPGFLLFSGASGGGIEQTTQDDNSREHDDCERTSNPVVVTSGNKVLEEVDFAGDGAGSFTLVRTYSKAWAGRGVFGEKWISNFDYKLSFHDSSFQTCYAEPWVNGEPCVGVTYEPTHVKVHRPNGAVYTYLWNSPNNRWEDSKSQHGLSIAWLAERADGTWEHHTDDHGVEIYSAGGRILSLKDVRGIGATFNYGANNQIISVVHTSGRTISLTWLNHKVRTVTGPHGAVYTYNYNTDGYLSSVVYPDGLGTRTYHYEQSGQPEALTGFSVNGERQTRYAYYSNGKVQWSGREGGVERDTFVYGSNYTDVTNALGHTIRYNFTTVNGIKRLSGIVTSTSTSCSGGTADIDYDARGFVSQRVDHNGNKTQYVWDDYGHLLEERSGIVGADTSGQQKTVYGWDVERNLLRTVTRYGNSATPISQIRYTYYPDHDANVGRRRMLWYLYHCVPTCSGGDIRLTNFLVTTHANGMINYIEVTDPISGTTRHLYTTEGDLFRVKNALVHYSTFYETNGLGRIGKKIDENGLVTRYQYDAKGRLTETIIEAPTGTRTYSLSYTPLDEISSVTDSTGRTINYVYDDIGRLTSFGEPTPDSTAPSARDFQLFYYDNLSKLINHQVRQTSITYMIVWENGEPTFVPVPTATDHGSRTWVNDQAGYLSREQGNNGQDLWHLYDAGGRRYRTTDSLDRRTDYEYDSHDRLIEVRDHDGESTFFRYDSLGRLDRVTDRRGKHTTYVYNDFGDLMSVQSPASGLTTYAYDVDGRRTGMTAANGRTEEYTYDALGRVIFIAASSPQLGSDYAQYVYDTCPGGVGRLCSVTSTGGTVAYTYISSGEVETQSSIIEGQTYTITNAYDSFGRLRTVSYTGGMKVRYTYNSAHRVNKVEAYVGGSWKNVAYNIRYQPYGALTALAYGNASTRTVSFDQDRRPTSIAGDASPQNLAYLYNSNNLITKITNSENTALTQTYAYDALSRLTSVTATVGNQAFGYDDNSNRTSHTWGGKVDTYEVGTSSNRLYAVISTGASTRERVYTHDGSGNLMTETVAGKTAEHLYDAFNRLTFRTQPSMAICQSTGACPSLPSGTWEYRHNGLGQRTFKQKSGGAITRYLYGPDGQLQAETAGATALSTFYIWLEGQPIGLVKAGTLYFVHADHLNRPEVVTNQAGTVVWRANNLAFDRTVTTNTIGGYNLGFPGQYYDSESATWYNYFRTYDGSVGRYTQSDPIGLAGGANTYRYAKANPLSNYDSLGLTACVDFVDSLVDQALSAVVPTPTLGRAMMDMAWSGRVPVSNPVSGFRPELVAGGQNAQVGRHVYFNAGGLLSGNSWVTAGMNVVDTLQPLIQSGRSRDEARAEVAGNYAGLVVGLRIKGARERLNSGCDREAVSNQLNEQLRGILCGL